MKEWRRRRQFLKAYRILRNIAEDHVNAGHKMHFMAINESHIQMTCRDCPYYENLPSALSFGFNIKKESPFTRFVKGTKQAWNNGITLK